MTDGSVPRVGRLGPPLFCLQVVSATESMAQRFIASGTSAKEAACAVNKLQDNFVLIVSARISDSRSFISTPA
jgi:hypothetical protein